MVRAHIQVVCLGLEFVVSLGIQVHVEDLFKHGHVCAVGARGRPHWPRYGRNGRSNLRCSIRPNGKEQVHMENGAGGDDGYGAESLNVAQRDTTSIRVFDGG